MAVRDEFPLLAAAELDEVITHSHVRDIALASGRTMALITLDNGRDHTRPSTLGPATLFELGDTLEAQRDRAAKGEIDAIAVTGKPYFLAAGVDLSNVADIPDRATAAELPRLGHRVLGLLHQAPVPTFVFINGLALGGGLEIGLNADYRTINAAAPAVGLPEVFLGLVPGWGGATILPNLIGIENALKVVVENPLKNNRTLKPAQALELGHGIDRDVKRARSFWRRACRLGDDQSCEDLVRVTAFLEEGGDAAACRAGDDEACAREIEARLSADDREGAVVIASAGCVAGAGQSCMRVAGFFLEDHETTAAVEAFKAACQSGVDEGCDRFAAARAAIAAGEAAAEVKAPAPSK